MIVVKQGNKNSHIVKCDYCNSEIMYWDNEIDKYFDTNYIICPVCKNKIELN